MPEDINTDIARDFVLHSVDVERVKSGFIIAIIPLFRSLERELISRLANADPTQPVRTSFQRRRLEALLRQTQGTIARTYTRASRIARSQAVEIAGLESREVLDLVNLRIGVPLLTTGLTEEQIEAIVSDAVIDGRPLKDWWAKESARTRDAFARQMRLGLSQGETLQQLINRIRGRSPAGGGPGSGGVMTVSRRNAESIVRTSVQQVMNDARKLSFEKNSDVIKGVEQISVLDGRTTEVCMAYSRNSWTIPGYEPIGDSLPWNGGPPRHVRCRSSVVPIVKSWRELSKKGSGWMDAPNTKREEEQKKEAFIRSLMRRGFTESKARSALESMQASLLGQSPDSFNYEDWLKTRSAEEQRDILGGSRFQLWKDGKLTLRDLISATEQRALTISELLAKIERRKAKR